MWQKNFVHAFDGQTERSGQHAHRHDRGRDRLGFAVAIRMRLVWRTRGDFQSAPDHDRAAHVQRGLDPVGDQNVGVAENARDNLGAGQDHVNDQTEQCDARAGLQIAGRNVRCRMQRERH